MRSNCCPVCVCTDNMPFSYITPLSIPLTGRRIQQRYVIFFASFLEVYSVFDISILERNSPNVLKFLVALSLSAIAFLLISPVTLLLSVLFVDNLQVCTPKAVCSFVWLCVQHGHRECICTDVRFDFQSPFPLFYIVRLVPFFFSFLFL